MEFTFVFFVTFTRARWQSEQTQGLTHIKQTHANSHEMSRRADEEI